MRSDRKLIELAKTQTLEALAKGFQRPPSSILKKAAKLGLSIRKTDLKK